MNRKIKIIFACLSFLVGCDNQMPKSHIIDYKSSDNFKFAFEAVSIGDSKSKVISKIGEPQEIRDLISSRDLYTIVGETFWYYIKEKSQNKVYRVSFSLDEKVIQLDNWVNEQ